jgi:NAD(P)-dependent dehydrogenase (short-subunit alcohol dehydrogenase family)
VAVVTGAGGGLGRAFSLGFAAAGARVVVADLDLGAAEATAGAVAQRGGEAVAVAADVADEASTRAMASTAVEAFGAIGVLVNNAANDMRHDWKTVTPGYWDERMAINLRPMFFAIQSVAPQMKRLGGGAIINFGSISWKLALGGLPAYTTAKAAVHGLTRGFARELGKDNIRVNTVLPGWVMSERQKKLWLTEAGERVMDQQQCLKGRLQPMDLARIVLFLASDDARMCSAQEFTVDGGWA